MRAAARARLLLLAALLLCSAATVLCGAAKGAHRASRKRSVRSRVSLDGDFSPAQRAELREKHDAGWRNITLAAGTCGKPPRGYDPPQWRREPPPSRRVALRGWLACNAAAGVYEPLFALPGPAWPVRDEAFTAAFKGKQRTLSISPADGVGRTMSEVEAGDWIPLKSFSYDAVLLQGQDAAEEPPPQPEAPQEARDASEL